MNRALAPFTPDRPTRLGRSNSLIDRRSLPVVLLLAAILTLSPSLTPEAGATGCYFVSGTVRIRGGVARTVTVVNPEAYSGIAVANVNSGQNVGNVVQTGDLAGSTGADKIQGPTKMAVSNYFGRIDALRGYSGNGPTSLRRVPIPSTVASTMSPGCRYVLEAEPTPAAVPVAITSPGSSVVRCEKKDTIS